MEKLKIAFFGTPDFAVPTIEMLHNHPQVDLVQVVSMPDRKSGRGQRLQSPPVAIFAKTNKVPLLQTENINKEENALASYQEKDLDVIIVLAFAQFLGKKVLQIPKKGCFNIHTSLLPSYRGAAPIQHALLNGDNITGVSIQKMVKKMDAGDVVLSNEIEISNNENFGQLYTRLKFQAALSTNTFLNNLIDDKLTYNSQDESKVTFAPSLKREDGHIDFSKMNFIEIKNKMKAFDPWPGIFCFLGKKRLKIFSIQQSQDTVPPGQTQVDSNELLVGCLDSTIRLSEVQLEGKKRSSDIDLLNGLKNSQEPFEVNPKGKEV